MDVAECKGMDPELFHPNRGEDTAAAKAVCAECLSRVECLEYALANNEKVGIWGGTSERERRALRRELNLAKPKPPIRHGTVRGATTHRARGEEPCQSCKDAVNVYAREAKERMRAERADTNTPA
jgi:WhiB family redox-sensing transcriptional regulator